MDDACDVSIRSRSLTITLFRSVVCPVCPLQLTPFEKNLEVWKQLWRVMERSHVVVQILDARNPLLFRSIDLEKYASEIDEGKTCLLVINKADYLTPLVRRMWADYLTAQGIDFVFWSAALEQARLDDVDRARRRKEQLHNYHGHNVDRVDAGRIRGASSDEDESDVEEADRSDEDESKFLHQHAVACASRARGLARTLSDDSLAGRCSDTRVSGASGKAAAAAAVTAVFGERIRARSAGLRARRPGQLS